MGQSSETSPKLRRHVPGQPSISSTSTGTSGHGLKTTSPHGAYLTSGATSVATRSTGAYAFNEMTPDQQEQFLEHMRNGMRRGAAAAVLKLDRIAVQDFIGNDPEYEKRVLDAEGEATEHVEEALYQAAVSGNVAAARIWLDQRRPKPSQLPV